MRKQFAEAAIEKTDSASTYFLTGDLGFQALEDVRAFYGKRFINTGVAEQNMIGVAAGLAREGNSVFVYSIAPFCYARPYEQIRNDICMSGLPVCLVGNGGGYAYGHMGPTHHALEDCAAMRAVGVKVVVPCFNEDLKTIIEQIAEPMYLRLGFDARPQNTPAPAYGAWRHILEGSNGTMAALGPLAGVAWQAFIDLPIADRPDIYAVAELDAADIPSRFWTGATKGSLFVVEEHVSHGGLGMVIAYAAAMQNHTLNRFVHRYAKGYPTGRYGSQEFHRRQSELDGEALKSLVSGAS